MRRLSGIPAADGIAFGRAFLTDRRRIRTPRHHIQASEVSSEIARFNRSLEETDGQLQRVKEKLQKAGGQEHTLILQAHQLILKDEQLVEQTKRFIAEELINAEWALRRTISGIKTLFDQVEDDYFRERRSDVDFVADHLMVTLTGHSWEHQEPPPDSIIVAYELSPADAARLYRCGVRGFVTEVGGRTSHTSIIARSLSIPAVVGIQGVIDQIGTGDQLIVDGYRGEVLSSPDAETERRYQRRARRRASIDSGLRIDRDLPAVTQDGARISLMANIELSDEIPSAQEQGAEGIGLYRTEFLYLGRDRLPTEEEHLKDALQVLDYCGDAEVTFRTCDLGVDKLPAQLPPSREANPSLGLRSIRLCLEQETMFKIQLRGLLRAAHRGNIRIMFPMISGIEIFRRARDLLDQCKSELEQEGLYPATRDVPVGIMVEMPSAAITADLLAAEADFFAIGTNDLTQYSLAIDRANEQVNQFFKPYHPAILRLIRQVVEAARAANIPITVCGEMAGDPLMTPVLLGLGVRQVSMNAQAIPAVKRVIRQIMIGQAEELARRIMGLSTPEEVECEVQRFLLELFPDEAFISFEDLEEDTIA